MEKENDDDNNNNNNNKNDLVDHNYEEILLLVIHHAAIQIQKHYRRKRIQTKYYSIIYLQKQKRHAIVIQKYVRRFITQRKYRFISSIKLHHAAIQIQKVVRRWNVYKHPIFVYVDLSSVASSSIAPSTARSSLSEFNVEKEDVEDDKNNINIKVEQVVKKQMPLKLIEPAIPLTPVDSVLQTIDQGIDTRDSISKPKIAEGNSDNDEVVDETGTLYSALPSMNRLNISISKLPSNNILSPPASPLHFGLEKKQIQKI